MPAGIAFTQMHLRGQGAGVARGMGKDRESLRAERPLRQVGSPAMCTYGDLHENAHVVLLIYYLSRLPMARL